MKYRVILEDDTHEIEVVFYADTFVDLVVKIEKYARREQLQNCSVVKVEKIRIR